MSWPNGHWAPDYFDVDKQQIYDDMVGILLQFGKHGSFVEMSLLLWNKTNEFSVKQGLWRYYKDCLFPTFKLEAEYKKILNSIPEAAKMSANWLHEVNNHDAILEHIYGPDQDTYTVNHRR